ncbi:MAG: hypothetical protein MJY60_05630, partial [Bacteroidales bacterium]|nr:hypothetical protein [Bacteroidales bacterium]
MRRRLLILIMAALLPVSAAAQYYSYGAEPSSVKWSQIKSEHFKMIFPQGMDSMARDYLCAMEMMRPSVNGPMLLNTHQIPVVLHPYTTLSNGSVSWAPKVVNLVTSPEPYDGTSDPWMMQLVNHELRHVAQCEHFTRDFYSWLWYGLGEQAAGLGMGLFTTKKYLEGDAVISETELNQVGRGRSASFLMYPRALLLDGNYLSWEQATMGSYHYQSINPYAIGYMLLAQERLRTDNASFTGEFFRDKARLYDIKRFLHPDQYTTYPSQDMMIAKTLRMFNIAWKQDLDMRGEFTQCKPLSREERLYTDYISAVRIADERSSFDGHVIALKKGLEHNNELVRINPVGVEQHVSYFNPVASKISDPAGGRIYWSETVMDEPSDLENFSVIKYLDINSGDIGFVTRDTKYFNPAVSPDGKYLAVAEYPVASATRLVLLNPSDGRVIASCAAPGAGQILEPCFSYGYIYVSAIAENGAGIWRIPYKDGLDDEWENVLPATGCEIRNLRSFDGGVCFASDFDGVMNIFSIDWKNSAVKQLTNSKYGANYPFFDADGQLYYSEYSSKGYHLVTADKSAFLDRDIKFKQPYLHPVAEALATQYAEKFTEAPVGNAAYLDQEQYPVEEYDKLRNAFHFHSWAPLYYNVDRIMNMSGDHLYEMASLGLTGYSQNELGTVTAMAGYSYHGGFNALHGKVNAVIADFDVEASFDFNDRKQRLDDPLLKEIQGDYQSVVTNRPYFTASIAADYPHNLFGGGWLSMFIPVARLTFSNDLCRYESESGELRNHFTGKFMFGSRYYKMLPVTKAAIFPRYGISAGLYFQLPMASAGQQSPLMYATVYGYLPGYDRSHGLKLSASYQRQATSGGKRFISESLASMPRGYTGISPTEAYGKITADYAVPVWLQDYTISKYLYLKRLQVIPFVDMALDSRHQLGKPVTNFLGSFGTDLTVDFYAFRLGFEINAGLRYAHTLPVAGRKGGNYFAPLFG